MKHTDFTEILNGIKQTMISELRDAIDAYDGQYRWPLHEGPIILAESDEIAEVFVVESVRAIYDDESSSIEIDGYWRDETGRMSHNQRHSFLWVEDDVPVEYIQTITSLIPDLG